MAKSKIDRLLDKENLTKEEMEYIRDYYEKKGLENLDEYERGYLRIAKILLGEEYGEHTN